MSDREDLLTVILATHLNLTWGLLSEVFDGEPGTELAHVEVRRFHGRTDLDAVVLDHWTAFEYVAGAQQPYSPPHDDESTMVSTAAVLDTFPMADYRGMTLPPWVVAEPTFRGGHSDLALGQPMYLMMVKILEAVDHFNALFGERAIQRLGYHLDRFQVEEPEPSQASIWRTEFEMIRQALRNHRATGGSATEREPV